MGPDHPGEGSGEGVRVPRESILERAPQQVALVERPHRSASLLASKHRPGGQAVVQARETYSPERVSTRTTSPTLMNSGT